jgi:hypothetical protein
LFSFKSEETLIMKIKSEQEEAIGKIEKITGYQLLINLK